MTDSDKPELTTGHKQSMELLKVLVLRNAKAWVALGGAWIVSSLDANMVIELGKQLEIDIDASLASVVVSFIVALVVWAVPNAKPKRNY